MRNVVVPRVSSFEDAVRVPVTDVIDRILHSDSPREIRLEGVDCEAALESIRIAYANDARVQVSESAKFKFGDDADYPIGANADSNCIWVHMDPTVVSKHTLTIAPWDRDDVIQYVLALAPQESRSILARIKPSDFAMVRGGNAVWQSIIQTMLNMPDEADFMKILRSILASKLPRSPLPFTRKESMKWLGDQFLHDGSLAKLLMMGDDPVYLALLQIPDLRMDIAADRFADLLDSSNKRILQTKQPSELLMEVSHRLRDSAGVMEFLKRCVYQSYASTAVSLLIRIAPNWKPEPAKKLDLREASLRLAHWDGVRLESTRFGNADLTGACFDNAMLHQSEFFSDRCEEATFIDAELDETKATKSSFADANFFRAKLHRTQWRECDLHMANFTGAKLAGAVFQACDLSDISFRTCEAIGVAFYECKITGADFTDAQLEGSRMQAHDLRETVFCRSNLTKTNLHRAVFGSQAMQQCIFDHADLNEAYLSGSSMKECSLQRASLIHARLAEVNWELCDLRGANLTGATFHYGSTRCGTLDSPYPSHGTRTGYYTDDRDTLYFQAPETIRKANLCGCDLRGAILTGVDFYLVDVRDAIMEPDQRKQIAASGGIVE